MFKENKSEQEVAFFKYFKAEFSYSDEKKRIFYALHHHFIIILPLKTYGLSTCLDGKQKKQEKRVYFFILSVQYTVCNVSVSLFRDVFVGLFS